MSNTFTRPPLPAIPPPSLHLLWPSTSVALPEPFPQEMLVSVRSSCSGQAGSWSVCPVGREKRLASKEKKISKLNIPPELLSQNQPSRRNPAVYKYTLNPESDSPGLCDLSSPKPPPAIASQRRPQEGAFCPVYRQADLALHQGKRRSSVFPM